MPALMRPGAKINFEVWGESGPWITLVNGHLRPLTDFRTLGQKLVREGFRVIAADNRGAGQTSVEGPFRLEDMAEDVAAVWDHVGCDSSALLGISMGGFIAMEVARRVPARVEKLILMSTAGSSSVLRADDPGWDKDPEKVLAKLSNYFAADYVRRNPLLVQSMAKQMARAAASGELQIQAKMQREAIRGFDAKPFLEQINRPTLIIHGSEDHVIDSSEGLLLSQGIPSTRWVLMPATGHLILAERPKELLGLILEFCH